MIISHEHKFIFFKTNKTAGTSVEIALSKFCGPDDVITPISKEDEKTRKQLGHRGPQNYRAPLRDWSMKDVAKFILGRGAKKRFYNHIQAELAKQYINEDSWDSYFKFCIERNPFDRCVSNYYWTHKEEPRPPFAKHVNLYSYRLKSGGYYLYSIDGNVIVDKICRFENLPEDLEIVRETIGLPTSLELPNAKSSYRKDKSHYRDIIDSESKSKISSIFSEEMRLLGYEW